MSLLAFRPKMVMEEFIALYRDFPCLWKVDAKEYNDRSKKKIAYEALVEKLKEIEPDANKDQVLKKINNIRSCYRKELKKVKASIKRGNGEDVYQPKLWYFELLNFLTDLKTPQGSRANLDSEDESGIEDFSTSGIHKRSSQDATCPPAKRRAEEEFSPTIMNLLPPLAEAKSVQPCVPVCNSEECDAISILWASKMRKLDEDQRVLAENLITQVLTKAYFGDLTRTTQIFDAAPSKSWKAVE